MPISNSHHSGVKLTSPFDVDEIAARIAEMWISYNDAKQIALKMGEETRAFIFSTDIDTTSGVDMPHKNRTHQPKLTQISDNLQSQYFEASLGTAKFFTYSSVDPAKELAARKIEAWVRTKLEQRKFRETVGRALIADYVNYGNCFPRVDFVTERDSLGNITYRGPDIVRVSPLDMVFNNQAVNFQKAAKVQRTFQHISDIEAWPEEFPNAGFSESAIKEALESRTDSYIEDWTEVVRQRGIEMDGYSNFNEYLRSGMVEVLIYRGDFFNPETGEVRKNRVIYVIDRAFVIRNEASSSLPPFDGMHHAGWRLRNDNLWSQGPLDNLVGMQYRIDHLENLKADIFDHVVHPQIVIKGDDVQEPDDPSKPGNVWYAGGDSDVDFKRPDPVVLNVDNQIAIYHRLMEEFAGAPPESRGIRTPGEKTAFEVETLQSNSTKMFVDKARNFELMLETMLTEIFHLMLRNFDGTDYVEIFNDITGSTELEQLAQEDAQVLGSFRATGSQHWERRNRESLELRSFSELAVQDPQGLGSHISKYKLAKLFALKLNLEDAEIVEKNIGAKEMAEAQVVAQQEAEELSRDTGGPTEEVPTGEGGGTPAGGQGTEPGQPT